MNTPQGGMWGIQAVQDLVGVAPSTCRVCELDTAASLLFPNPNPRSPLQSTHKWGVSTLISHKELALIHSFTYSFISSSIQQPVFGAPHLKEHLNFTVAQGVNDFFHDNALFTELGRQW